MVPTTATVRAGARVAIVLKRDQPTGRLTHGTVQTLLTRGEHPRGIKVRLADGRVGRVQRVLEGEGLGQAGQEGITKQVAGEGDGAAAATNMQPRQQQQQQQRRPNYRHVRDIRLDDEHLLAPAQDDTVARHELADFMRPARRGKNKGKAEARQGGGSNGAEEPKAKLVKCPVCGEFEGDEPAVAHHVAEHFTEAPCA